MKTDSAKLTDAQVEIWRKTICAQIGPHALTLTREQVLAHRARIQRGIAQLGVHYYRIHQAIDHLEA